VDGREQQRLQVADLELDLLRRRVLRAGRRIDLTAKEFALLELLLRRQGEVLPRSLIASQVWDMNFGQRHQRHRESRYGGFVRRSTTISSPS